MILIQKTYKSERGITMNEMQQKGIEIGDTIFLALNSGKITEARITRYKNLSGGKKPGFFITESNGAETYLPFSRIGKEGELAFLTYQEAKAEVQRRKGETA